MPNLFDRAATLTKSTETGKDASFLLTEIFVKPNETFLSAVTDLLLSQHRKKKTGDAGKLAQNLNFSLGARASESELLSDLKAFFDGTPNVLSPKFMNQLFSGLRSEALAGEWAATLANSTMATYEVAPIATMMERELVRKMQRLVGWNGGDGIMVTGGSNANLLGLLVARNTLFPDTKKSGNGNRNFCLFVSEEAHYSFEKAANILGLGTESVIKVKSSHEGKLLPEDLRQKIVDAQARGQTPFFVAATAGTTVLGGFDPIDEISLVCKEFGLWLHVDGAWGGSVILSPKHRHLLSGIESADSFAWDTHKMLGTGLMSSFFLTKHKGSLVQSNNSGGQDYIFHESDESSLDTGPSSLQCGRRNDAFKVWLTWRSLGDEGLTLLVDQLFDLAKSARDLVVNTPELELLYEPEMLNVCFRIRHKSKEFQKIVRKELLKDGEFFVNIANRRGDTFFRLITTHPDLTTAQLENLFLKIITIAGRPRETL
jgi:glutamate/tyrosine decarboxylase-like PLP-dependent enzyme